MSVRRLSLQLQLEVMQGESFCVEVALRHTIKVESFEQSLACQGTGVANTHSGHSERRPQNVYTVSDQKGAIEAPALHQKVDELQTALTQATKGIAAGGTFGE